MRIQDARLKTLMSPISCADGLILRDAYFLQSKEFRISWRISGDQADVGISDYLSDAPDGVLTEFSRTVFDTMADRKPVCGPEFMDWTTSDGFIMDKRRIYLNRSRNLSRSDAGCPCDLAGSLDRLLDSGLLVAHDIDNSVFAWTVKPNIRRIGYCSPMMRVVAISSALDAPHVPEYVLDYVVYHESLHLRQGYRPFERRHDPEFKRMERMFPRFAEAERYLSTLERRR